MPVKVMGKMQLRPRHCQSMDCRWGSNEVLEMILCLFLDAEWAYVVK